MRPCLAVLLALVVAPVYGAEDRLYVDPAYGTTSYEELSKPAKPLLLKISVAQTLFGRPYPHDPQGRTRARVVRILQASGLVRSSYAGEDGSIAITLNDALEKNWRDGSGPGMRAREVYELAVVISTGGRTITKNYEYAIFRYRGKAREPAGQTRPLTTGEAVDALVEQMLLHALLDLQREGVIPAGNRT